MKNNKIKVAFFQRKPRKASFSIEFIFNDIRNRLINKIEATVYISKQYNDGYLSKFSNITEAARNQSNSVNHITGEVHFLNLLMRAKHVLLTIHDCGMMQRKTGLSKKIVQWLYLKGPVKKAQFITTVSEITKNEVIKYTGANPDKIQVIPVAVNSIFKPSPKPFNKTKPTILHIGTAYNKNLPRLIEALNGVNCHLTIVGKLSDEILSALKDNQIDYSNEYGVSNERIVEKYMECDIMAFVSTFEGFGMPIVEANVVERVVVTANISSMPEVAGNAACLVDPFSVQEIKAGILKVIDDDTYRDMLINNGKINRQRFDGDKIANMYFDIYKKIVEKID